MTKLVFRSIFFWSFDSKRLTIFGWILARIEILKNKNTSPREQNNCHSAVSVSAHPMSKAQHCTGLFAIRSPVLFIILCHIINLPSIILRKNAPTVAGRILERGTWWTILHTSSGGKDYCNDRGYAKSTFPALSVRYMYSVYYQLHINIWRRLLAMLCFWHWVRGYRHSAVAIILPRGLVFFVFQDFYFWQCSAKSCQSFGVKRPKNMDMKTSFAINQICIID